MLLDRRAPRLRNSNPIDPAVPKVIDQYTCLRCGDAGVEQQVDAAKHSTASAQASAASTTCPTSERASVPKRSESSRS